MLRKILLAAALATGLFGAGALTAGSAHAITITAPAALDHAAGESQIDKVRYVCRRYWNGYRWKRNCWWRPGPSYGYGYSRPYRPYRYGYRSYRRW